MLLLDTIEPQLDNASFLIAMGVLGVGMGLIVSQLGNVVQSAVGEDERSEAGGLQNTAQQLGSSLGTAFLGAVVITGLLAAFSANVQSNPRIDAGIKEEVEVRMSAGASFVPASQVKATAEAEGVAAGDGRRAGRRLRRRPAGRPEDRLPVRRGAGPGRVLRHPQPAHQTLR